MSKKSVARSMQLNKTALAAAARDISKGAVTASISKHRQQIINLLNDSLATELVCVLRYRLHAFTASGEASPKIAEEFMTHANAELAHADRLAQRIVQLGGDPDLNPDSLTGRSHAKYEACTDLQAMIRSNLVAERVAVESYRQMIELIGEEDPTTRHVLEGILADEEDHAEELSDWLDA